MSYQTSFLVSPSAHYAFTQYVTDHDLPSATQANYRGRYRILVHDLTDSNIEDLTTIEGVELW